jgi:hypothetical protein
VAELGRDVDDHEAKDVTVLLFAGSHRSARSGAEVRP